MQNKTVVLGVSFLLVLSFQDAAFSEETDIILQSSLTTATEKPSKFSQQNLILDSSENNFVQESRGQLSFFEESGSAPNSLKSSQDEGDVTVYDVESIARSEIEISTQALGLLSPEVGNFAEQQVLGIRTLIAQDSTDEADTEATEATEAAESASGFSFPGEISATATITTNYVFRGISQTDNNPAIQGSFDYTVGLIEDLDFYAGIWGSNIDFGDEADFGGASLGTLELDFYGGVTYALTEKATVGGSIVYYFYPGADDSLDFDYIEFGLDASYDFGVVSTAINFAYSPDFFGGSEDGFYVVGTAEAPLPLGLSASAGIGYQAIGDNDVFGAPDYLEWNIGVGYSIAGFDLLLQYIDTDLNESECFGGTDLCDARVVFSASRTF